MTNKYETGVRQLKNGLWAYRFCTSVNGRRIEGRGSTDLDGNVLRTKQDLLSCLGFRITAVLSGKAC